MPYPNNLDIYDFKLAILQAETLCNTAKEKKKFYEKKINSVTIYFKKHKKKILKFGGVVKVGDKIIDGRGKEPDTTHGKYYKDDYDKFIHEINNAISDLWWNVEMEKEIGKCENKKGIDKKLQAFITLKKKYKDYLCDIDIILKDSNPKAYETDRILYTEHLQIIEKRIIELLDKKMKKGVISWIKRVFKASKVKTPISETDLGKI